MAAPVSTPTSSSATTINIRETPAVVEYTAQVVDGTAWTDADTVTSCYPALSSNSSPITFNLFFDPSSNAAFFKLRTAISVRDSSRDKIQTYVSLFIYPEHVASLVHDKLSTQASEVAAVASKRLSGCRATCLRFTLSKPASLVAPLHVPLAPKSKKDAQVLRSLHMLANTTTLAVHFAHDALPTSELIALVCNAANTKALKSSLTHGDLSRLYGGQGGKVLEVDYQNWPVPHVEEEQETAALEISAESPPSYDELAPNPPFLHAGRSLKRPRASAGYSEGRLDSPPLHAGRSLKRPRASAGYSEGGLDSPPLHAGRSLKRPRASSGHSEGGLDAPDLMGLCRKAVAEQIALLRGGLQAEIRREVKAQLGELEDGLMERVDKRLEDQISELREDLLGQVDSTDDRVDEVERHMDDLIDERIEDRVLGVKIDMQDFVKDEMANVEDTIIKHFEDGRISLQFER